jgi:hypothetical protein
MGTGFRHAGQCPLDHTMCERVIRGPKTSFHNSSSGIFTQRSASATALRRISAAHP